MSTEQHYPLLPAALPTATSATSRSMSAPIGRKTSQTARLPYKARIGFSLLRRADRGLLLLVDPDGHEHRFGHADAVNRLCEAQSQVPTDQAAPAIWHLRDWSLFSRVLSRGDVGFGECWMEGLWDSPDPTAVLRFMLQNRESLDAGIYGSRLGQWFDRIRHVLRRNSRRGSKRNIRAHYDLGNAFYRLWLDDSMTYSSGLLDPGKDEPKSLTTDSERLALAQHQKYERILDELDIEAGASILEIGCGWGGFAMHARKRHMHLKCLTLSSEQLNYAEKIHAEASGQRPHDFGSATFCLQDYRDEQGSYDGIVSIEMFEAVGEAYWDNYFERLRQCLKPGAKAVIQSITIDEQYFERYRSSTDFIQQYIFPGGMLPSPERLIAVAEANGLKVCNRLHFGADYAWTLARWHERFLNAEPEVRALGYDERFIRMWRFYLSYCEAGFAEGATDVVQFSFIRS